MIIFDDYEFMKLIMSGEAPVCQNRNNVLRTCAKMIDRGDYEFTDVLNQLTEHFPKFNVTDRLLGEYVENMTISPPVQPHVVVFGFGEVRSIANLPTKTEQKLYLYQLFLFKYFNTHRLRVSQREFKRLAGVAPQHYSLNDIHLGHGLTVRRETKENRVLHDYNNNKPYLYYYPTRKPGKTVTSFLYEGDSFMLPSEPFESNLSELWDKYREAKDKYL